MDIDCIFPEETLVVGYSERQWPGGETDDTQDLWSGADFWASVTVSKNRKRKEEKQTAARRSRFMAFHSERYLHEKTAIRVQRLPKRMPWMARADFAALQGPGWTEAGTPKVSCNLPEKRKGLG